jgi:hypothetical protein
MKNLSSNNNNKGTSTNNNNKKEREQHELIGSVSVPFQIPEAQSPVNTAQRDGCYQHRGTSKESKATSKLNTFTTHIFHTDHKITTFISSTKKRPIETSIIERPEQYPHHWYLSVPVY